MSEGQDHIKDNITGIHEIPEGMSAKEALVENLERELGLSDD